MTKEEFYVASSRTRGKTFLYATPEVQPAREEIAPASPYLRGGLEHVAEAAERIGAQTAAMDEALRSRFSQMPSDQLVEQIHALSAEIGAEHQAQQAHRDLAERQRDNELEWSRLQHARERLPEPRRWERRADRSERESAARDLNRREGLARERAEVLRSEAQRLPEVRHDARAQRAVIESVLADRERLATAAARLSPPGYITAELGQRPGDPGKARHWDEAVRGIERYRLHNNVKDKSSALGAKPKGRDKARDHDHARRRIERAQRHLRLHQAKVRQRQSARILGRGIGR